MKPNARLMQNGVLLYLLFLLSISFIKPQVFAKESTEEKISVKVFNKPQKRGGPEDVAEYRIRERFLELHPNIELVSSMSLTIEGDVQDVAALMSIAGGTSPDVLYVNFRQSDTYISRGFLSPLDEYVSRMSPEEFSSRVPPSILPVIYREGPGGKHYWVMPSKEPVAMVLSYRRDLFAAAGLDPDKPPQTWNELQEVARRVADPSKGIYALGFYTGPHSSWGIYSYLCSAGAQVVKQLPNGEWRATFDSPEAVTAFEFVDDLQKEQVTKNGRMGPIAFRGSDVYSKWLDGKLAMYFRYLGVGQSGSLDPQLVGTTPVPKGPTGKSSSEVNCEMMGLFAGQRDKRIRDAAWEYMQFVNSLEARKIYTQTMVEYGAWRQVNPKMLRMFGYPELAKLLPSGLEETFELVLKQGTPEPYGKNCQYVYSYLSKPLDEIFFYDFKGMTQDQRRTKIKEFLTHAVQETNEKMIGILPEPIRQKRNGVAWVVAAISLVGFIILVRQIFSWIALTRLPVAESGKAHYRDRFAIILIAPALLLVLMWQYYPLLRGSIMAFQDYNVLGGSHWMGINNFADIIFDERLWSSLKRAFYFCALWMLMGFFPPVFLAIMLQEIPLGKILFRVLFYLPAVVTGVVILFMWRAIYDPSPDGILNRILILFHIPPQTWLQNPKLAMFCVVFPLAWAQLGPNCIIYLAALKGIPEELYEAADIDGASFFRKLRYIVLPYLKPLLVINSVAAFMFGFKSGDAVLAMTGGGPNFATHVIGFEIWQRSYMFLQFGQGTAMAWILGMLLLSFTAYQLRILTKVEFRTANR